jgi:hypothetical protein
MIIEYFFCSNKQDVSLYNPQKLANAVVYALTNNYPITNNNQPIINNSTPTLYLNGNYDVKGKVVRTNGEGLNIRAEANLASKVVGQVYEGQVFTIVEVKNNMYKLKSGIGWISANSKYVKKM